MGKCRAGLGYSHQLPSARTQQEVFAALKISSLNLELREAKANEYSEQCKQSLKPAVGSSCLKFTHQQRSARALLLHTDKQLAQVHKQCTLHGLDFRHTPASLSLLESREVLRPSL